MDTSRVDGVKDAEHHVVADVALRGIYLLDDVDARVPKNAEDLSQHARAVLVDDADALDGI